MTTVLVCGGRDYDDRDNVFSVLDALYAEHHFTRVIHGGAMGADYLAHEWASRNRIARSEHVPKRRSRYNEDD